MEDILSCRICLVPYNLSNKQPRLLKCCHTFCEECLNSWRQDKSVKCPFCFQITSLPPGGAFPLNFALRDVIESSLIISKSLLCEVCSDEHVATNWCTECEQRMCNDAKEQHFKIRVTAKHQVCLLDNPKLVSHKAIMCSNHPNKEIELVCKQDNQLICVICVATTHSGHTCLTLEESYREREKDIENLIREAKQRSAKMKEDIDNASNEKDKILNHQHKLKEEIDSLFTKAVQRIEQQRASLIREVDILSEDTLKPLSVHIGEIEYSVRSITHVVQQLEAARENKDAAGAIVVMKQLESYLKSTGNLSPLPVATDVIFRGSDDFQVKAHVTQLSSENTTLERLDATSLIIQSQDSQGNTLIAKSNYFSVSAVDIRKNPVEVKLIHRSPNVEVQLKTPAAVVEVKLRDNHIQNSPCFDCVRGWSWSPNNTQNTTINKNLLTSSKLGGGWGMIQEQLDLEPRTLNLNIYSPGTGGWCQIAFYTSNTVFLKAGHKLEDAFEYLNLAPKINKAATNVKIEREVGSWMTLRVNNILVWRKCLPKVYLYVDIYWPNAVAEIV